MKTIKTTVAAALFASVALPAFAMEEGKLVIWTGGSKAEEQLQAVADKFSADLGIDVVVEVCRYGVR